MDSYIGVKTPEGISFGGSQKWLAKKESRRGSVLSRYGCGLVALGDFLLMAGELDFRLRPSEKNLGRPFPKEGETWTQADYLAYLRCLGRGYLRILPRIGANAWQLWYGFWKYQRESGARLRCHWGVWPWKQKQAILSSLERGLPVIFCVGPNVNPFLRKGGISLYQERRGALVKTGRIAGHYMNITGWCEDGEGEAFLQVSSWGKCYYLSWREFLAYKRSQPPVLGSWLSNIFYVQIPDILKNCRNMQGETLRRESFASSKHVCQKNGRSGVLKRLL